MGIIISDEIEKECIIYSRYIQTENTVKKHHVNFGTAACIFKDVNRLEWYDEQHSIKKDFHKRQCFRCEMSRATYVPGSFWKKAFCLTKDIKSYKFI